jgi:hypothetical protein
MRSLGVVLGTLVLLAACASSPSHAPTPTKDEPTHAVQYLDVTSWQAPFGQTCHPEALETLPRFEMVFDTAGLLEAARSVEIAGSLLASFETDTLGLPLGLLLIESTLSHPDTEQLLESLFSTFRGSAAYGPGHTSGRIRLDLAPGTPPRARIGPRQLCDPVLLNRRQISAYLSDAAGANPNRRGRLMLWVFVETDGAVRSIQMREPSGYDYLDAVTVGIASRMVFHPALVDRTPLPVWIQIPFNVE